MFDIALFDLDGTILDSAECGVIATQAAFEKSGYRIPDRDEIIHLMGVPIELSFPDLAGMSMSDGALADLLATFRAVYRELSSEHIRLFDGMHDLLSRLHGAGTTMAVVTSKHSHVAARNIAATGIDAFFKVVVGPDMVSRHKPHADTALKAIELLCAGGDMKAIVIGDSSYDIRMGKAANLQTCAVTWGAHSEDELAKSDPTHIVRTVAQLESLLLNGGAGSLNA
jgi:phosphoglycolate phosphatase